MSHPIIAGCVNSAGALLTMLICFFLQILVILIALAATVASVVRGRSLREADLARVTWWLSLVLASVMVVAALVEGIKGPADTIAVLLAISVPPLISLVCLKLCGRGLKPSTSSSNEGNE